MRPEASDREADIPTSSEPGPERLSERKVAALTTDLMDRSRLSAAIPGIVFALVDDADVVIIDLARGVDQVASVRASHPAARIVAYGPHVDDASMTAARAAGANVILPRSKFFRDPATASGV